MRVEVVSAAHLAAIADIEAACFAEPWSEQALSLLVGDGAFGLACIDEATGHVIAYLGVLIALDEGQITNVATHPLWRRRGCADALLHALRRACAARGLCTLSLEVRKSNEVAIALYRKHGFAVAGERPRFYTSPVESALVMVCNL